MTRDEYLAQLRALLTGRMPPDELERILAYYSDYFNEAGPEGEARVLQELGTPAELVGRILGAGRVRETAEDRPPMDDRRGMGLPALWKVLLAICAAPIAIPLVVAGAAVVLAVLVSVAALVLGAVIGGGVCVAAGIAAAWMGFAVLFSDGLASMMLCCGVGMLSSGVGLLLIGGSFALGGLCYRATARAMSRWLLRKEARV